MSPNTIPSSHTALLPALIVAGGLALYQSEIVSIEISATVRRIHHIGDYCTGVMEYWSVGCKNGKRSSLYSFTIVS
jgi:hypothetical protein